MADAGFHLAFPVRIPDTARHRNSAIVCEHIPIERVQSGIVNIGREYTFFKVVGNHDSGRAAHPPEGLLMQFGPDAGTGLEAEKPYAFAAKAERQYEQTCAAILAGLRIADHGASAVIDLRLFTRRGLDDAARFRRLSSAQFAGVTLDALIGAGEPMPVHQFLPDGHGVSALRQARFDEFAIRLTGTGGWLRYGFQTARVGGHLTAIGRFCRLRVGGHFIGRF